LGADFAKLPYLDSLNIDRRTDTANLASSISYQPFNNQASLLPGVHLHWALPDAMTQGEVVDEDLVMPTVPNRWLVVYRNSSGTSIRSWVVESDYLYSPNSNPPLQSVCIPWKLGEDDREAGTPPYRFLGRQVELTQWQQSQEQSSSQAGRYPNLNVLGWGNPYFSALYDECSSVFGCYDKETTSIEQVKNTSYEVIGWYSNSDEDYVQQHLQQELSARNDKVSEADSDLQKAQQELSQAQQAYASSPTNERAQRVADAEESVQMAEQSKQEKTNEATLQQVATDIADWNVDSVTNDQNTMLCFGRIQFSADASSDDGVDLSETELALASFGTEAMATYLSQKLTNTDTTGMTDEQRQETEETVAAQQEMVENQLVAVSLSDTVQGENVDFINRLKTARHKEGFAQVEGGVLWAFVGIQDLDLEDNDNVSDADKQNAETQIRDTLETFVSHWNDDLKQLNDWQEQINQLTVSVENQREQLYADWTKYMLCLYPTDRLNDQAYPDTDRVKHFIETKTMPILDAMLANQQQLEQRVEARKQEVDSAFQASLVTLQNQLDILHLTLETAPTLALAVRRIPAPRYWKAEEPAILITGTVAKPSQRHGADGVLNCFSVASGVTSLNDWAVTADTNQLSLPWEQATNDWSSQPWNPMSMEWDVNLYPDHEAVNANSEVQDYSSDFVQGNYRVPLNDDEFSLPSSAVDLRPRENSFTLSVSPTTVKGRSLLTAGVRDMVETQWNEYLEEKLEEKGVNTFDEYKVQLPNNTFDDPIYTVGSAIERLTSSDVWISIFWSPSDTYATGSYVMKDNLLYRSNTTIEPGDWDIVKWDDMTWQDEISYVQGDYVYYSNTLYKANTNIVADPLKAWDASQWNDMSWQEGGSYSEGDYVLRDSQLLRNQPMSLLTQRLTGLHDEYLMQRSGLRLPTEDPSRFFDLVGDEDKSFTAQVRSRLSGHTFKLPSPWQRFTPIRSGVSQINQLRIVDSFGRFKDIDTNRALKRPQRQILTDQPNVTGKQVYLPPRVVQPLRLHWRWHMLPSSEWEGYTQPTPVCGWMMYNYFDETLVIYNTSGQSLGAINSDGEWQSEIGAIQNLDVINNVHLRTLVEKLLSFHTNSEGNNYLPILKKAIQRAQDNIDPQASTPERAFMASQPLAVVRATLNLQLQGMPEVNKSWQGLEQDLYASQSYQRSSRQFTSVEFPIKIGEFRNMDDGLVCYWTQDQQGNLSTEGSFPQSDMDDLPNWIDAANFNPDEHDYVDLIRAEGMANLTHSFDEQPIDLLMIMEPDAPVHATTGIIPKKSLLLESTMYKDALDTIQQYHCAAPLLTPQDDQALPLPIGTWQWGQRDINENVTYWPSVSRVEKSTFETEGGTQAEWDLLTQESILRINPDNPEQAYYFMPEDNPPIGTDGSNLFTEERWQVLQTVLQASTSPSLQSINHTDPLNEKPIVAVEGYFKKINLPNAE
jgi:hypothetical protein